MSAEISIDKKKVGDFLAEGKVRQYLIPGGLYLGMKFATAFYSRSENHD